jgi:hypothetical protein
MPMTRQEHIKWCKERAIAELNFYGNNPEGYKNAIVSMMSDIRKHPETNSEALVSLCGMQLMILQTMNRQKVIDFINGFN